MTPDHLIAALDDRIARYQIAREVLLELGAPVLLGPASPAAAKPKALPAGKAEAPAPQANGPGMLGRSAVVPLMLRALADRGPLQKAEIARLVGIDPQSAGYHLETKTSLFRQQPGHRRSPWELTDAGRKAAAALPPAV